jgi:uncharacterized protein
MPKVGKLPNPARDAAAIEALLRTAGFDAVEVKRDLGRDAMRRALRDFSDRVRDADIAVVFYAGHGIEVNGANYLIPVDAVLERDIDVEDETVPLDRISQILEPAKRLRLIVLDACRDNPFAPVMRRTLAGRSIGRGLARVEAPTADTLIAFAAKAGSIAADGQGANSPYTLALVKHLATPGLDVRLALGRVRDEVMKSTNSKQEPFVYGSLGGAEIALVPGSAPVGVVPPVLPSSSAADAARVCREVEGMSSRTLLGVLAGQHKGTPAADCIAARLTELARIEADHAAAAAKKKAVEEASAKAEAQRICANVETVANIAVLNAMADRYRGTPTEACIVARIDALQKQQLALTAPSTHGVIEVRLMTGPAAGFWAPLGGQLKGAWEKAAPNLKIQALPGASISNVRAIQDGRAEIGFANAISTAEAVAGTGEPPLDRRHDKVCNVASLYPQYYQLVVRAGSGISALGDLRGKAVVTQAKGNTGELITRHVLRAVGLTYSDVKAGFTNSYADSVEQMKDGRMQAFGLSTGVPASSLMDLAYTWDIKLLDMTGIYDTMRRINPAYKLVTIPMGSYPKQGTDVQVIGYYAHVIAACSLPADVVHRMTAAIFANRDSMAATYRDLAKLTPQFMAQEIGVPFHAGAARWYREQGVAVR